MPKNKRNSRSRTPRIVQSEWDKKRLSRRLFLGGAGAAVSLPMLTSALPKGVRADMGDVPCRFLAYYVACGIHMDEWIPDRQGAGFDLKQVLEPIMPIQDKMTVVSGLANTPALPDGPGHHAAGTGGFLTCAHIRKTEGSDIRNGISADQVIANAIGDSTRFPSMQLGMDGGGNTGNCDSGYSCAYARNISWADTTTPLPKLTDPRVIFDQMFGGFDPGATTAEQRRRIAHRTSVLDYVLEEANTLKRRLGRRDSHKLDQYLTSVREVETRVAMTDVEPSCSPPERPGDGLGFRARLDTMTELMALAFQCDITRVISFMFANAGSGRSYDFLGHSGGHHNYSHHMGNAANHRALIAINKFEVEQFTRLAMRLNELEAEDGSPLLDHCALYFASEIEDGNSHGAYDKPVLLAGSAGGAWTPGRHVRLGGDPPMANLFISIMRSMGVMATEFGDNGTGPLDLG